MNQSEFKTIASKSRLSCARLKRAGTMVVVALCKAALLVTLLESSGLVLESTSEVSECLNVELANLTESHHGPLRYVLLKNPALGSLRCDPGASGNHCLEQVRCFSLADGHRLPNGLLAPRLC